LFAFTILTAYSQFGQLILFFSQNVFFYFLKMCIENLTENFEKRALLKPQKRIDIIVIVV